MPSMAFIPPYVVPARSGWAVKLVRAVTREWSGAWHFSVHCWWCGKAWPRRFRTYRQGLRFLRQHVPACYRRRLVRASVITVREEDRLWLS